MIMTRFVLLATAISVLVACGSGGTESDVGSGGDTQGVQSGQAQKNIGSGSKLAWDSSKCVLVEGRTEWRWGGWVGGTGDADNRFYINHPSDDSSITFVAEKEIRIRILKTSLCSLNAETRIEYSTKDWFCPGDVVTIDGSSCAIDRIDE